MNQNKQQEIYSLAGMFTLTLRLVVGWTYFSAFLRRLVLENKLDPDGAGYIGEKFNNFLPNALGIKPMIEYLVSNLVFSADGSELSQFPEQHIRNHYVAKVKPGTHSLIIPLGSKAELTLHNVAASELGKGTYELTLIDISGIRWTESIDY